MSYRYYMTVSPVDGMLYLTDFHKKQILRVKDTDPAAGTFAMTENYEVIAGEMIIR